MVICKLVLQSMNNFTMLSITLRNYNVLMKRFDQSLNYRPQELCMCTGQNNQKNVLGSNYTFYPNFVSHTKITYSMIQYLNCWTVCSMSS